MVVSKYCASGNDFLIFHTFGDVLSFNKSEFASRICDRHYGIGADGMVILKPSDVHGVSYQWEFYNADGSGVHMCGNASRAAGMYAFINKLAYTKHSFLSGTTKIDIEIMETEGERSARVKSYLGTYKSSGSFIERRNMDLYDFDLIEVNIPHLVCKARSFREYEMLVNDTQFLCTLRKKYDANVSIAFENEDDKHIYYSTYERGLERVTLACGTAACAVYVAFGNFVGESTLVPPSREELQVGCLDGRLYFSGLTRFVLECSVSLD